MDILKIEPNEDDEYLEDAELDAEIEEEESGQAPAPRNGFTQRKSFKAALGGVFIYTLVLIGNTIGTLVTLNNATPLEFGQGSVIAMACDTDGMTVRPLSKIDSITAPGTFELSGIRISGISDECLNRNFELTIYNKSGDKVLLGYKNIVSGSSANADQAKFILTRVAEDYPGVDWKVFTTNSLPDPLVATGLPICGGEFDLSEQIDYDWGDSIPKPGCPSDSYTVHWSGFIKVPLTDDGKSHDVNFKLVTTGLVKMNINKTPIISSTSTSTERTIDGAFSFKYGRAYPFELWMAKPSGVGKVTLKWDVGGLNIVPSTAFQYDASASVLIPTSEGTTDYSITANSFTSNNITLTLNFIRKVTTDDAYKFTLETS